MIIYNNGILKVGAGIGLNTDCCCDDEPPCESCLSLLPFSVDRTDDFYIDVALSEVTMAPDPVCNGQEATLTFKILNLTGDAWPADCDPGNESDCAVVLDMFSSGTALTILSTTPAASISSSGNDRTAQWNNQSFSIGEEKTYSVTFRMEGCVSDLGFDCYYGRGYRGSITLDCIPCP
jgi:hypothetical protein